MKAFVVEAELCLAAGTDPASVGAAVTVELCGHWRHPSACRWPHNSAIDVHVGSARFRTLFVAADAESAAIAERIEGVLRGASAWGVGSVRSRPVAEDERALAERLLSGPRASA